MESNMNEFNNTTNNPGRFILGVIGAFIGSLVGVAVWILLYQIGFIAGISGVVMTICALWCYEKLAGKQDKKGVIVTLIVIIIMGFAANFICYGIEIYKAFKEDGITIIDGIKYVPEFLKYDDIKRDFIIDLLMGYAFCLFGSFQKLKSVFQSAKQS